MKNSDAASAQGTLVGVILFVIVIITGVFGLVQAFHTQPQAQARAERSATERHFYAAIAGEESTSSASVENQLADDLAATPIDELGSFRGDSNRYGGITDAVGFDPFNGSGLNCTECGPLKPSVLSKVKAAKSGQQVLLDTPQEGADSGFTLTPFGVSVFVYLIALWLVIGHVSYLFTASLRDDKSVDSRMIFTAPGVAAWTAFSANRAEHRDRQEISSVFPDAVEQIDAADEFLKKLPADSPTVARLRELRDEVEAELRRQARQSTYGRDEGKLAALTASLTAMSDTLRGRAEALDDLSSL